VGMIDDNNCDEECQCDTCRPVRNLIMRMGNEMHGERVPDIMLAMVTLMADLSVKLSIPKQEFTAQVYTHLCEMIDEINDSNNDDGEGDNDNGNCTLQ
jgi:hypothetical protein